MKIVGSPFERNIMYVCLGAEPFDFIPLEETFLSQKLQFCSCFDTESVNSYHVYYYFGLFAAVCDPETEHRTEKLDVEDMILELPWKLFKDFYICN